MGINNMKNYKWILAACLIIAGGCAANAEKTPETTAVPEDTASETAAPEIENDVITLEYLDGCNTRQTVIAESKETVDEYKSYLTAIAPFETTQPKNDFSKAESITAADSKLSYIWLEEYTPAKISGTCQLIRLEQAHQQTLYYAVDAESEEGHLLECLIGDIQTESFRVPEGKIALSQSGSAESILTVDPALSEKFNQLYEAIINDSAQQSGSQELEHGYDIIGDGVIQTYRGTISYMLLNDKNVYYIELSNPHSGEVRFFEITADSSCASMLKELIDNLIKAVD